MSVSNLEPIVKIFADSTEELVQRVDGYVTAAEMLGTFSKNTLANMEKLVIQIQNSADTLLFDNISEASTALIKLLESYRDQRASEPDFDQMEEVMAAYSAFVHNEIAKLTGGAAVDGVADDVINLIKSMDTGDVGFDKSPTRKPGESAGARKRYYIPSETASDEVKAEVESYRKEESAVCKNEPVPPEIKSPNEVLVTLKNKLTNYTVTDDQMEDLRQISHDFNDIIESVFSEVSGDNEIATILSELNEQLKLWVDNARLDDLKQIVTKCRVAAIEMAHQQGKKVMFNVDCGDDEEATYRACRLEKYKISPLSKAVTHIIRNSIDHGIESPEERKEAGKSDIGNVTVKIRPADRFEGVMISLSDDGRGVDTAKLLKRASMRGILTKSADEYTKEEILELPFKAGFNSRNDRQTTGSFGVNAGAEAAGKLIGDIHGMIKVSSEAGKGTAVTFELPYDHISDLANFL